MRLIFITLVAVLVQTFSASASTENPAFFADKWDIYDGSERLGLLHEKCGDGWPQGYTARQASGILKGISKSEGVRLMESCDPKDLASRSQTAPSRKGGTARPQVLNVPRPELQRIEHPFATVSRDKQYRCWIDTNGRHRVAADDPKGTGWCYGKAVGDN